MSQSNDAVTTHIRETNLIPILKQLSEYIPTKEASILENKFIIEYRKNNWNILNRVGGGATGSEERIWTKDLCHKEALKYKTRSEFYYRSNKIYSAAQRYEWLDEICSHMISKIKHWTINEVKIEALKYKSRSEFQFKNKAAYTWAIRHNILNIICSHMCSMVGNNQFKQKYNE